MNDGEIVVLQREWSKIRGDSRFIELMRLARLTNQLSLAWSPLLNTLSDQSPRARRERFAAFFYAAALIKEGIPIAQGLARWYRELPQYAEGFGRILANAKYMGLYSQQLGKIRNEVVLHADREPIEEGLKHFPDADARVPSYPEIGPANGEIYFDAADDAVLGYLFGAETAAQYLEDLASFMGLFSELFRDFMVASNRLRFADLGFGKREFERPVGFDDEAA